MNGFYIKEKHKCDKQIGMQNLDADWIYIYVYNPKTKRHEGVWKSRHELFGRDKQ